MSVVVAHQQSATSRLVLQAAAQEASLRGPPWHHRVSEASTSTSSKHERRVFGARSRRPSGRPPCSDVEWTLRVGSGADVAETILALATDADAELLVIGARRRTPVGKMLMGSVTQTLLLRADVPVLVVQPPARS